MGHYENKFLDSLIAGSEETGGRGESRQVFGKLSFSVETIIIKISTF